MSKVIIICDSDIILKGLSAILSDCNADEVFLMHHKKELNDYPHLSGYILLIMPLNIINNYETQLKQILINAKNIKYLHLIFEEKNSINSSDIHINDKPNSIVNKVNELLNSFWTKKVNEPINDLTKREVDVLLLVAKGLANKEIADKLSISIHTVISHRKNVSEKTGIKSASGLTMYAVLKKLIDIDEISTSDLI